MTDLYSNQPLTSEDAARMREHMERAQREDREWLEARLHHGLHHNWLGPDECPNCLLDAQGPDYVYVSGEALKQMQSVNIGMSEPEE